MKIETVIPMILRVCLVVACLCAPTRVAAQGTEAGPGSWAADSVAVHAALDRFLTSFEHLDWESFRAAFSDSATVFHPVPGMPERVTGRAAVEASFATVFETIRTHASDGPPYQRLEPHDLEIRSLGPGAAYVSFHLRTNEWLGRRSVILRKEPGGWRILHLHASIMPHS